MLQTLVENSIKHGISTLPEGGKLIITGKKDKDSYELSVINSGQYDPSPKKGNTSVGLQNTRMRLKLLYGNKSHFHIGNITINDKNFVETRLVLPLRIQTTKIPAYASTDY